jgi:hypothetical protein
MRRRHSLEICLATLITAVPPLLTGCALSSTAKPSDAMPSDVSDLHLQGMVHGGQQALGHALIQLYQVGVGTVPGAAGYAANATPLIGSAVYSATDGSGGFSITGTYSCSAGAQVYLTATGGTIDGTTTNSNPNITLMAALGSCSSLLANASTGYIVVNEVSTVAAAYALAQFAATSNFGTALSAKPGSSTVAPADNIATSSGNIQGLVNAMATAAVMANTYSSTAIPTGTSSGNNTNGTASVEYWTINTVANILAACINSAATTLATAGDGSMCGKLYQYTTPSGKTAPADTFQAAVYMALYPGDSNLLSGTYPGSNLTNLISASPPFLPYVAPDGSRNFINDWTIGISYSPTLPATAGGPGSGATLISVPYELAVDSYGNIWSYNVNTAKPSFLLETDPTGNPVLSAPAPGSTTCKVSTACATTDYQIVSFRKYGGTGSINWSLQVTSSAFGLALDPFNNVWADDRTGKYMVFVGGSGGASTPNGGYLNGAAEAYQITTGAPIVPAVDGNGVPWFAVNATATNASCTSQTVTGGSYNLASIQGASTSTGQGGALAYGGPGGVSGSSIAIDAGNPVCTASTSTMACNATIYDKLSGSSAAIAGSPFVWVQYNTGQGGALPNTAKASTVGHYTTGDGGFTVPGCESPLGQIGDADASVTPTTAVPDINPSGSDTIDFMAQGRGISFGQGNKMWFANNNYTDANSTIQNSIASYVPAYGTAFTPASFQTASPAFTSYTGGGLAPTFGVQALAVDGSNSPWAFGLNTATGATQTPLVHLSSTGAVLSTATGLVGATYYNPNTSTSMHRTTGVSSYGGGIDGSGNVWAPDSDSTSTSIYVVVGAATPVVAPLSLGVRNGTLGMMP